MFSRKHGYRLDSNQEFLALAGVEFLTELHETLKKRGIEPRLAETHSVVREALRRGGFEKHHGPVVVDQTVTAILLKNGVPNIPIASLNQTLQAPSHHGYQTPHHRNRLRLPRLRFVRAQR